MKSAKEKREFLQGLLRGNRQISELITDDSEPDYEKMVTSQLKKILSIMDRIGVDNITKKDPRLTTEEKEFMESIPYTYPHSNLNFDHLPIEDIEELLSLYGGNRVGKIDYSQLTDGVLETIVSIENHRKNQQTNI